MSEKVKRRNNFSDEKNILGLVAIEFIELPIKPWFE